MVYCRVEKSRRHLHIQQQTSAVEVPNDKNIIPRKIMFLFDETSFYNNNYQMNSK